MVVSATGEKNNTGKRFNGCMRRSVLNVYGAPTIILHALIGTDYTILSKTTKKWREICIDKEFMVYLEKTKDRKINK